MRASPKCQSISSFNVMNTSSSQHELKFPRRCGGLNWGSFVEGDGVLELGFGLVAFVKAHEVGRVMKGGMGVVYDRAKAHWLDGDYVVSCGAEGEATRISVPDGKLILADSCADGGRLAVITNDERVVLVDGGEANSLMETILAAEMVAAKVISLSTTHRLYIDDSLLANDVNSFLVSHPHGYLCYIAAEGGEPALRFLDLKKGVIEFDEMAGLDDASPWASSGSRPVDSHTTLVAVLPNSPMAVLRHHRGNFEGVYPRPLVLREVRRLLKERSWSSAFDMCRRMKVDLNLIVDYDYNSFLEGGELWGRVRGLRLGHSL